MDGSDFYQCSPSNPSRGLGQRRKLRCFREELSLLVHGGVMAGAHDGLFKDWFFPLSFPNLLT